MSQRGLLNSLYLGYSWNESSELLGEFCNCPTGSVVADMKNIEEWTSGPQKW
jgi:hypothetical protein|eukprot:CAMPEP_0174363348 /NCGR_PEP_ID=MMETSP0811_2-20130205/68517_1 /TAXON_ID=73025 ORGANISM="Eutreptiella gymnastica-like, Strain CCMP1594" /NCGR_SAMPLE_ID=MMETSP0811_2 /ASSEMBLY_ACC=CAM_ASM_000667 /LENGTH=51 /DNA_ID=CAMNT_0015501969 /DNA_START=589 /DNA_END=744 /DNA_ORIENTATION=+